MVKKVRTQTPICLLAGRSGAAYRTNTHLELREAHAAARDAVRAELHLFADADSDLVQKWSLFEVCSQAKSKDEYLLRPDLGRRLNDSSRAEVRRHCVTRHDLQIVIGDGLSVTALGTRLPWLFSLLLQAGTCLG